MKRILVALGGNAIKKPGEVGTLNNQMENINIAAKQLSQIAKSGFKLVITHGNGPQVGNLAIQQEIAMDEAPPQPLFILVAMTQGQIGYMIQQSLVNLLEEGDENQVVTVVTRVLVDKDDPDFQNPSKPVGPFYIKERAQNLSKENDWVVKKVRPTGDENWRRVVPSPEPLGMVEIKAIKILLDSRMVVIASGGGGIPVIRNSEGSLEGIEAVVDKDKASAKLAEEIGADTFLVLTDVEYAMKNFGGPKEEAIKEMTITEARGLIEEGHFGAGSMKPKIEACISFIESGGGKAIITSMEKALDGLEGITGTRVIPD
jgi:carbamate kinase